jgi:hypothetical protein
MAEMQWIEVAAGEAWTRSVTSELGPINIATQTLRFQVLTDFAGTVKFKNTSTITDPQNGVFRIDMTSTECFVTVGAGNWAWEVWRIDAGAETREAFGRLVISATAGVPT